LGDLLIKEIEEGDCQWIDYENEETQVKLDLADMVLRDLVTELADILQARAAQQL
jgi:hypothetical protein